ncbi:MAG: hypothetical protein WC755_09065 [Candidatus Woesearchaeota archaeon]|jgi:hypothetical protein
MKKILLLAAVLLICFMYYQQYYLYPVVWMSSTNITSDFENTEIVDVKYKDNRTLIRLKNTKEYMRIPGDHRNDIVLNKPVNISRVTSNFDCRSGKGSIDPTKWTFKYHIIIDNYSAKAGNEK